MKRRHTDETKKKISEGVKRHHANRRLMDTPEKRRREELADKFTEGNPDKVRPSKVRNYGDLGKDVKVTFLDVDIPEGKGVLNSPASGNPERELVNGRR